MEQAIGGPVKKALLIEDLGEQVRRQGAFPAGHYYSPIPSREDVLSHIRSRTAPTTDLPGINLNEKGQREALGEYAILYRDLLFTEKQTAAYRYYYDNEWFGYSDATFLHCFLRQHAPKKIIEIGSGFSSAVILDTIDGYLSHRPEVTFIEPHPYRLDKVLRSSDREQVVLIDKNIQDVQLDTLLALGSGDLLFVDSSHVVKCGSDLQLLMFEILPRLSSGVFVHFHDVFYPFEYPAEWLAEGRYWNESYFLRAFLSNNAEWNIRLFTDYLHVMFGDFIEKEMPLCARNRGGSLYIQRENRS